jgi:hypothetical protein
MPATKNKEINAPRSVKKIPTLIPQTLPVKPVINLVFYVQDQILTNVLDAIINSLEMLPLDFVTQKPMCKKNY